MTYPYTLLSTTKNYSGLPNAHTLLLQPKLPAALSRFSMLLDLMIYMLSFGIPPVPQLLSFIIAFEGCPAARCALLREVNFRNLFIILQYLLRETRKKFFLVNNCNYLINIKPAVACWQRAAVELISVLQVICESAFFELYLVILS